MKAVLSIATLILAGTTLAGCKSEAQLRNEVRTQAIAQCKTSAGQSLGAGATPAAIDQYCGCVTDRVMAGRTIEQMANLQGATPQDTQNAMECVQQAFGGAAAGAPPADTANAAAPAPAAPGAPAEPAH